MKISHRADAHNFYGILMRPLKGPLFHGWVGCVSRALVIAVHV